MIVCLIFVFVHEFMSMYEYLGTEEILYDQR